jgi:glycosyltransferase involved in cell wall biosynthesis
VAPASTAGPPVAFVVPRYGPGIVGGAETLCRMVAENLAANGTPVEVFTTCAIDHFTWANHHPEGTTREGGVPVHRFAVSGARDDALFWRHHTAIALNHHLGYAEQVEWMANGARSDGLQDALAARRDWWIVGVPYLFGTAFWAAAAHPGRAALIPCMHDEPHARLPIVRDALTGVAGCMANSEGERALIAELAPEATATVVGVGYEPASPPTERQVEEFCRARGIAPGYLLYAGRREEGKGVPLLFRHYARYRTSRPEAPPLALMGSGDLPVPADLAEHVIELGFVPDADRGAAYAGASVLIHPSTLESFGMVLLEAWIAGTPALVNGGSAVLVSHCRTSGGGLWFDSPEEFEAALDALLEDPDLRRRMAEAGAAYAFGTFSWAEVRGRFLGALAAWS